MARSKASPWIVGTVLLCVGILALAWFVLISPQLAQASTVRDDAEQTRAQNAIQQQRVDTLKRQFAELDVYKAELAEIGTRIPSGAEVPDLLRAFAAEAEAAGVTVLSVAPGTPEEFFAATEGAAPPPAQPEPDADDDDVTEDANATDEVATPAPAAGGAGDGVPGMVAVPVQVTVLGGYDAVTDFVRRVQGEIPRLYVVTTFEITGQEEQEASNGRPATQEGDAEMIINGYVYVLLDEEPGAGAPVDGTDTTETVNT